MSICNFNRELICATCLSQDGKLIAMRDSQACILSYSELSLKLTDRICWVCHDFVQRMVAFKIRVQQSRAWLQNMANIQQHRLLCISPLTPIGISTNARPVNIIGTEPCVSPNVKPELLEETVKQEVKEIDISRHSEVCHSWPLQQSYVEVPAAPGPIIDTVATPLVKHEGDDNVDNCDTVEAHERTDGKDIEMSVFTHQKGPSVKAVPPNKSKKRKTAQNSQAQTNIPDYIYTEKILTEEEMLEWRQKKPNTEYYSRGVPTERCEKCIEPFDCKMLKKAHAARHTERYGELECDICQQRAVDAPSMAVHRKWHYRLLTCRYCPLVWDNVNTMRRHCSEMHNVPQVEWDCDLCESQFPSRRRWQKHGCSHRWARCPVCEQMYVEGGLKIHMLRHTGGVPLKTCAECGGQYRGASGLRLHMLTHRTEVDVTAYCTECNIQFRSQATYRAHLRSSKHATKEEYRFECNECGKKFLNLTAIRSHMDLHNDTQYPCRQCKRVFNTRYSRQRHVRRVHMGKARREYICDYCGKISTSRTVLTGHINSHTGARPHACKICGDTFGYKSALYLHGRYKHKIQKITKKNAKSSKKVDT